MAFLKNISKRLNLSAAPKGKQSSAKINIMPLPLPSPSTPAERCRAESFKGLKNSLLGDPKQVSNEQACLEKARLTAFITFAKKAQGVSDKLNASPSLKSKPKSEYEVFSDDVLKVKSSRLVNLNFESSPNKGISVFRPEILNIMNFEPVFDGNPQLGHLTSAGQMIEAQWQGAKVREQSLSELHQSMQKRGSKTSEEADQIYKAMQDNFETVVNETDQLADIFGNSIKRMDNVAGHFNLKKMWNNRSPDMSLLDLKAFYNQHMGFNESQFNSFSNTKIFIQLLSDFRQVLENYSFNLLDLVDSNRPGDHNPVTIDTSVTLSDGFSFTSELLRSETTPLNATDRKISDKFLQSLPDDPGDRIKVLINFLSKELRISSGLGQGNQASKILQEEWGAGTDGSPFNDIIGEAGNTIFDAPLGQNSLMTLAYQNVVLPAQPGSQPGEVTVLPFEEKYVDSDEKDFVPGSSFFVDRFYDLETINGELAFNTGPLKQYVDRFTSRSVKAKQVIMRLLLLTENGGVAQYDIQPQIIYDRMANSIKDATKGIDQNVDADNHGRDSLQAFTVAMFKLANDDRILKNLLFQYLIMMGILSNVNNNPGSVWADLAIELGDLSALSSIQLPRDYKGETSLLLGPKVLAPLMKGVADNIHRVVRTKLLAGLIGNKKERERARKNPKLTRKAISRFKQEGERAFSKLGIPISIAVNTDFISNALLQIANETTFIKDPNLFREFVDVAAKLTDGIGIQGHKGYLVPDGSGRTRFNYVSTSHQLLIIFEIMAAMTAKFGYSEFRREGLDIVIDTNISLTNFLSKQIENMAGAKFDREGSTLGGFQKALKSQLGVDNPEKYAKDVIQFDKLPPIKNKEGKGDYLDNLKKRVGESKNGQGQVFSSRRRNQAEQNLHTGLLDIRTKLDAENYIIVNFLWLIQKIGQDMLNAKDKAISYFNKDLLQLALKAGSIEDLRIMKDPAQVTLMAFLNNELNLRSRNAFVNADIELDAESAKRNPIITNTVSEDAKEALYSYLQEPEFQKESSTLVKVFSVGVPAEFVRNTQDRINKNKIVQNSFKQKEADVLTINVHKRDLRRPELIFKPQKFLFDMSLFQREQDIIRNTKPEPGETHSTLVARNEIIDFAKPASIQVYTKLGKNSILSDKKYDFLNPEERLRLLRNHYQSFLLETYIKMSTGMSINEKLYAIDATPPSKIMDIGFEALLLSYIKDIQGEKIPDGQTTQELLVNPSVPQNVKDTIMSMVTGQVMATPMTERDKILKPKKFDRVFHFPVNIDDFEIDIKEMEATVVGKQSLQKAALQNQFRNNRVYKDNGDTRPLYLKKRTSQDIIFEDFFVTLESQGDE